MSTPRRPDEDWDVTREEPRRRRPREEQGGLFGSEPGPPPPHIQAAFGLPPGSDPAPGKPEPAAPAASAHPPEPPASPEPPAPRAGAARGARGTQRPARKAEPASLPPGGDEGAPAKPRGRSRKASPAAPGEAVVAVRSRAFAREEAEQEPLPLDEGLPPGVAAPPRKGRGRGGGLLPPRGPKKLADGPWRREPVVKAIERSASAVHAAILKGDKPELKSPVRSLSNVRYREKVGYFEIGRQSKVRTLTVNTVRTFAQTLRMMSLSKEMVAENTFATKRDAYYQSKNWEDARFDEQAESDAVMDDIEAMFSVEGLSREELRFYPEEHGGAVAGELTVIDRDPVTGGSIEIDCTRFGSGAYTIPHSVEHLKFRTSARFILAIETGGMFYRLQYHAYPHKAQCIIVSMAGVPTRACRRFIRRLSEERKIPVYAFVDCDPYGISNIYRSLKVGSGNAAHINRFFCVPGARFLGVTPDDITKYKLPTHPLKDVDVQRARDALKNDPFFSVHKEWAAAMQKLLAMGVRAEQQALAKWGLNYVMDVYLPEKLKDPDSFLP
jgi:DNA topoisomerase-6 subunit A